MSSWLKKGARDPSRWKGCCSVKELVEGGCYCGVVKKKGCCGEGDEGRRSEVERERGDNIFNTRNLESQTSHNFSIALWGKKPGEAKLRIMFRLNKHNNGKIVGLPTGKF